MLALLVTLAMVPTARGFDLSWIPADGEGPLPLSRAYRDQLARLCDIVEGKDASALPPSIASRLADIERMCAKLKSSQAVAPRGFLRRGVAALSLAAGGGYAWHSYESRGWLYKVVRDGRRRRFPSASSILRPPSSSGKRSGRVFDPL